MPNKPMSKREQDSGIRFVRIRGRIVPIRAGSEHQRRAERQGAKATRYITKDEAPKAMRDFGESASRASKSAFGSSAIFGIMGAATGLAALAVGSKGKILGKVAKMMPMDKSDKLVMGVGSTGFAGMSVLGAGVGVGLRKESKLAMKEAKRIEKGKNPIAAKDMSSLRVRMISTILRKHVRKTPQGFRK